MTNSSSIGALWQSSRRRFSFVMSPRLGWWLSALLATVPLVTAWQFRFVQQYDDQYITFTYARSLAAGQGFTYNGGWTLMGTTTPGWTLVLAALARVVPWVSIPILSHLLSGLCASATVLSLYGIGCQMGYSFAGLATAALLAFDPLFPWFMGSEYSLLLMLCTLSFALALRRRYPLAALFASLALITRYDAAIFVGLLALWVLWQERRIPWQPMLVLVLVFGGWLLSAYLIFGSALPASLVTKQAHVSLGSWPPLDKGFLQWFQYTGHLRQLVFALLGLLPIGLIGVAIYRAGWLLPIMAWGVLYVLFYLEVGVAFYFWYFVPAWFTLTVAASGSIAVLSGWHVARSDSSRWQKISSWSVRLVASGTLVLLVAFAAYNYLTVELRRNLRSPQPQIYTETGEWLKTNTPQDAKVGFIEVGYIGFYSERRVVDPLGLVTPGIEPYLVNKDFTGIVAQYQPEYYLRNTTQDDWLMTQQIKSDWFQEHYVPVHEIKRSDYPGSMIIYKRVDKVGEVDGADKPNAAAQEPAPLSDALPVQEPTEGSVAFRVQSAEETSAAGDLEGARSTYAKLLAGDLKPDERFDILMRWAIMERTHENPVSAIDLLKQAIVLRPDDVEAHANYGAVLLDAGHPEDSAREFEYVMGRAPDHYWAHYLGGVAYQRSGHLDKALTALKKAVELGPEQWMRNQAAVGVIGAALELKDCESVHQVLGANPSLLDSDDALRRRVEEACG